MKRISSIFQTGVICLVAFAMPFSVNAKELRCVSAGYCTYDLTCDVNDLAETLIVKFGKGNRAEFGWDEADARFIATGVRKNDFTVYAAGSDSATQTFVLADNMTASMSVTTHFLNELYVSFHRLTCQEAPE